MRDLSSTYKIIHPRYCPEDWCPVLEHARQDLEKLISSGCIQGSIDASTGIVSSAWASNGELVAEVDLPELLERVQETVQLSHKLRDIKMEVLISKEYVKEYHLNLK